MATSLHPPIQDNHCRKNIALSILNWLRKIYDRRTLVSIEEIETQSGQSFYYIADPRTGRTRYVETSNEVVSCLQSFRLSR